MPTPLSGPGLGLPLPQYLYPSELNNAPLDSSNNKIALAPGDQLPVPAGTWYIDLGKYNVLQYLDPVTNTWSLLADGAWTMGPLYIKSDGFNIRVANLTGCPVSASVLATGSGFVQSTTTLTATGGNSTWTPIVGGQLALVGGTLTSHGAGYGVPPIVLIPPPPPASANSNGVGGIQATGYCTIANGTVSGFTFTNPGAGYPTAPTPKILPNPTDPNLSTGITAAVMAFSLAGSGGITGALLTNPGNALATVSGITLTPGGAGSGATLTPNVLQTVTAASVVGTVSGLQASVSALVTTVGGTPNAGSITNSPEFLRLAWRPRMANIGLTVTGVGSIAPQAGTIYDGGLFQSTPTAVLAYGLAPSNAGTITNAATLTLTMGSRPDIVTLQPAP